MTTEKNEQDYRTLRDRLHSWYSIGYLGNLLRAAMVCARSMLPGHGDRDRLRLALVEELVIIYNSLDELKNRVNADESLPAEEDYLNVVRTLNFVRSKVIELDVALRRRHKERHPFKMTVPDWREPTQPLDPETRAEIDSTP